MLRADYTTEERETFQKFRYETFDEFVEGITDCLNRVETDYKSELATLMKPNFQRLKNVSLLAL